MRKLFGPIVLIVLAFMSRQSLSQVVSMKPSSDYLAKMSEILPPAPDASSIGRYGGVEIDLSSGLINKLIQLRPVTDKGIEVPVLLRYTTAGLTANEYPSRVGMGWTFSAGGQISRTVRGRDDLISERYMPSFTIVPPDETGNQLSTYCYNLLSGNKDAEPDLFTFNFNNYSGRFVFDHDGSILPLPASNLKIRYNTQTATDPSWNFCITTPDGIKYYFGGPGATESTKFGSSLSGGVYTTNVWQLTKIVHPVGHSITFAYESGQIDPYLVGKTQTHFSLAVDHGVDICMNGYCTNGTLPTQFEQLTYMSANTALLKQITTSFGAKLVFSYSSLGYPEKLINDITYFNEQGFQVQQYVFNYTEVATVTGGNTLPFLQKVTEKNYAGVLLNGGYEFTYYNLNDIPGRVSHAQDHWGYYNKKNNPTLIPAPSDLELQYKFPFATANRDADPLYGANGLLHTIQYPTGGKDEVIYEPNITREQQDVNPYTTVTASIAGNSDLNYRQSTIVPFSIGYETRVRLVEKSITSGTISAPNPGSQITIKNAANVIVKQVFLSPPASGQKVETEFFNLPTGSYTLYVETRGLNITTTGELTFRNGASPNIQSVNVVVGGQRVQKTITTDGVTNVPVTKRFYYGTMDSLTISSAYNVPKPRYYTPFESTVSLWSPCITSYRTYDHSALNYNALNRLYLHDGNLVRYASVVESIGGDNFENGAIEHKFQFTYDIPPQILRGAENVDAPLTNDSYFSKGEVETHIYSKGASALTRVSSVLNDYTFDSRKYKSIAALNVYGDPDYPCLTWSGNLIVGPVPMVHIYSVNRYYITSAWKYLSKKTEKTFDENGQNPIVNVSDYYYDDDRNLMLSRIEVLNSKGELMKKQIKYPHDFAAAGNVYDTMVARNMIAFPVEEKLFNNNVMQYTSKSNYDFSWFADKHLVAISNIDLQKGTAAIESKFRYYQYDTYGNPRELAKENDAKQSIVWDYRNNYPVAKVVNASQSEIAYTSFEDDGKGNWNFSGIPVFDASSPSGRKAYVLLSDNITRTGLSPTGTYIVSYWSKTGTKTVNGSPAVTGRSVNGWTCYMHTVANPAGGQITVSGSGAIDELRLYPKNALMTSFTFEPSVGITSQIDEKNNVLYYQYDGFGRLIVVRDQDNNIVSKHCYNYTGQSEQCNYYFNDPQTQNFVKNDCPAGYTGSSVTYTVPGYKYVSTVSVIDANALAQADISTNGQAYANAIGSCTVVCNASNCSGQDKKCINGICRTGTKVYTSSVQIHGSLWECTYHYEWIDGSWSPNYIEYSTSRCFNIDN